MVRSQITPKLVVVVILVALLAFAPKNARALTDAAQIDSILHQLGGDDLQAYFGFSPKIEIMPSASENAFALAPNRIILTSALLHRIDKRSDLCFVISHEISHLILGQSANIRSTLLPGEIYALQIENELKADKKALELMRLAGIDTSQVAQFLTSFANIRPSESASLFLRIRAIKP